jgi:hypothetical protein
MQKVNYALVILVLISVTGCKTIQSLGDAFAGGGSEGPDAAKAQVVAETVQRSIPFLPSPLREVVVAGVAGLAAYGAARRKKEGWKNA